MKRLNILFFVFVVTACASAPKGDPTSSTTATGTATVTSVSTAAEMQAKDVIAGQVVGEEPMMEVSKHANVRLLQGGSELANITAEPDGSFRFEGPFTKGRYEISVRDGKLHGAREISFPGGEMTNLSVIVSDGKGDKHHRHHRRRRH